MKHDHDKIRELYATGNYTQRQLAAQFGCDRGTISRAVGPQVDAKERGYVRVVYCPENLFTGGKFGMGDLVAGATEFDVQRKHGQRLPERKFVLADGENSIYQEPNGIS